jgi:hypothetical protein
MRSATRIRPEKINALADSRGRVSLTALGRLDVRSGERDAEGVGDHLFYWYGSTLLISAGEFLLAKERLGGRDPSVMEVLVARANGRSAGGADCVRRPVEPRRQLRLAVGGRHPGQALQVR